MFLCCGDALYDLFVDDGARGTGSNADTQVALAGGVGGSPMNVAVALARLGHHSRYFTKLSSDLFGVRMRRFLDDNGIDRTLTVDTGLNTTLAIVETAADGAARYAFYTDNTADATVERDDLPAALPGAVRVLHFGSYTTAVEPTGSSLLALATREAGRRAISFDPNVRPTIEPDLDKWREVFAGYAAEATIIKASDEDIAALLGPGREEQFVADCFGHGAAIAYVTRGPGGASAYAPDGREATQRALEVPVVDTVGAGDAFQAAILHWLAVEGHIGDGPGLLGTVDLERSLALANRIAAITCTRRGPDSPRLEEVLEI